MSDRPILLDTHAALWTSEPGKLSAAAEDEVRAAHRLGLGVFMSPISAWELGMLVARGRLALPIPPGAWFDGLAQSGVRWAALTPDVLVDASFLPGQIHGDPADRILTATARAFNYRLMTRDRALLAYAAAGHLQAVPC